jgi:hypothetical protein
MRASSASWATGHDEEMTATDERSQFASRKWQFASPAPRRFCFRPQLRAPLEMKVLGLLARGSRSPRSASGCERLRASGSDLAYTTVMTVLVRHRLPEGRPRLAAVLLPFAKLAFELGRGRDHPARREHRRRSRFPAPSGWG